MIWFGSHYNAQHYIHLSLFFCLGVEWSWRSLRLLLTTISTLGVDKLDQLMAYYSFLYKSVKWWRKIFWLLEVMVINAYIIIIYKELAKRRETNDSPSY